MNDKARLCFARAREPDRIVLTPMGVGRFCIDPIEKNPQHFLPGTPVLVPARRAAISPATSARTGTSNARELARLHDLASPETIAERLCDQAAVRPHPPAFTYNDPVIFLEYAI